jgi:hypothetical protein
MKNSTQHVSINLTLINLPLLFLLLLFSCKDKSETVSPTETMRNAYSPNESTSEYLGQMFYNHISQHALEDPLNILSEPDRLILAAKFDSLKAIGNISHKSVLDHALAKGEISKTARDVLLQYDHDLVEYVQQNPNADQSVKWCLAKEEAIKSRKDLNNAEKSRILNHQAILRYYVKYTLETLPLESSYTGPIARTAGGQTILCYLGCAVSNIGAYSGVGGLAGTAGTWIGAGVGLIITIINSEACGCGSPTPCGYATSISSADACYSSSAGKTFTAWGYGATPIQFTWNFHPNDISYSPLVRATSVDNYKLTHAEWTGTTFPNLNSAPKIAARITSNCSGTYFYSQYLWFAHSDAGKPRPIINVYEEGGNRARYVVNGANIQSVEFAYVPPYRGTVVSSTSNSITVQWEPNMRIGVYVTANSACGSTGTSAY